MKKLGLDDVLETERCILKIPQESEAEEMWNLITSKTTEYVNWSKGNDNSEILKNIQKRFFEAKNGISWQAGIYLKENNSLIGSIGFQNFKEDIHSSEIGYWISEKYGKQGFMIECLNNLINYSFTKLQWNSLIIRTDIPNLSSRRLAEKCGFSLDGILRKNSLTQGKIVDVIHYSITKEDFERYRAMKK